MLRNDVLSHHATVENVNGAGAELLESSPGDEASHLRDQLDQLNQSWQSLLLKTQERQKQLEAALQQVPRKNGGVGRRVFMCSSTSLVCFCVGRRFPW